jgi:prophage DNA circulation protein
MRPRWPPTPSSPRRSGRAATAIAVDPRTTAAALLTSAGAVSGAADPTPGPALALATQALILAAAVQVASDIPFTSKQDATDWRNRQDAALAAAGAVAAGLAAQYPTTAGALWQSIADARAKLAADMSERIGRLPSVVAVTFPGPAPLWMIAHHFSGDVPGAMLTRFADLVARNDIGQPGMVTASPIEALL